MRTEDRNRLELIESYSIESPKYQETGTYIRNSYTGEPITFGTGLILDLYILLSQNKSDMIRLYINHIRDQR